MPGSTWTQLWQLNNKGQLAASSNVGSAILQAGQWTPLASPPASSGYGPADIGALGLDDAGNVAGGAFSEATGLEQAFTLIAGSYSFFVDVVAGTQAEARSLRDDGLISGWSPDSGVGWVYNPGAAVPGYGAGFTTITPTLSGAAADLTLPGALAPSGVLVGTAWFFGYGDKQAFIYDPSAAQPFTIFQVGGLRSAARGINTAGTIVGFVNPPGNQHGAGVIYVLRQGNTQMIACRDLLGPTDSDLYAESINDAELISGGYYDSAGNIHGVLVYPDVLMPSGGVYSAQVTAGRAVYLGAPAAHAYRVDSTGGPGFASVTLPLDAAASYTIAVDDQRYVVPAGGRLDFSGELRSFRVLDADYTTASTSPSALVLQVTFTRSGAFTGRVQPLCTAAAASKDAGCH